MSIPNIKTENWPVDLNIENWRKLVGEYFQLLNASRWRKIFPIKKVQCTEFGGTIAIGAYYLRRDGDFSELLMTSMDDYWYVEPAEKVLNNLGWKESFEWVEEGIAKLRR